MIADRVLSQCIERIDTILNDVEALPDPNLRGQVQDLVQALLEYHAAATARLLRLVQEHNGGDSSLADALAGDELVVSLLLLHGLHPADLEARVLRGLDSVRPYLESHGGNVEFVGIEDGIVHLALERSCHGCPSSSATVQSRIERAISERLSLEDASVHG